MTAEARDLTRIFFDPGSPFSPSMTDQVLVYLFSYQLHLFLPLSKQLHSNSLPKRKWWSSCCALLTIGSFPPHLTRLAPRSGSIIIQVIFPLEPFSSFKKKPFPNYPFRCRSPIREVSPPLTSRYDRDFPHNGKSSNSPDLFFPRRPLPFLKAPCSSTLPRDTPRRNPPLDLFPSEDFGIGALPAWDFLQRSLFFERPPHSSIPPPPF